MMNYFTPRFLFKIDSVLQPLALFLLAAILPLALYFALINSPVDYQQGEMVRIMYVHVPSAWMSLGIYTFIAFCSISSLVWRNRLSYIMAISIAPVGAVFAFITLLTGSLWGRPIWGAWWVWDARLTSMLVLFLQYITYITIINSDSNILKAEKPASAIAIIGLINIPIVKFSVNIWHSLHQPASVFRAGGSTIHASMMKPLLMMFFCFILYSLLLLLIRTKTILNQQKYNKKYDICCN